MTARPKMWATAVVLTFVRTTAASVLIKPTVWAVAVALTDATLLAMMARLPEALMEALPPMLIVAAGDGETFVRPFKTLFVTLIETEAAAERLILRPWRLASVMGMVSAGQLTCTPGMAMFAPSGEVI